DQHGEDLPVEAQRGPPEAASALRDRDPGLAGQLHHQVGVPGPRPVRPVVLVIHAITIEPATDRPVTAASAPRFASSVARSARSAGRARRLAAWFLAVWPKAFEH